MTGVLSPAPASRKCSSTPLTFAMWLPIGSPGLAWASAVTHTAKTSIARRLHMTFALPRAATRLRGRATLTVRGCNPLSRRSAGQRATKRRRRLVRREQALDAELVDRHVARGAERRERREEAELRRAGTE